MPGTISPTLQPSAAPIKAPSTGPTRLPTKPPSFSPSNSPSTSPTITPIINPTVAPSSPPTVPPSKSPSSNSTASRNKTFVGLLSYKDPLKCKVLQSFVVYPTSTCLVMGNTHPDESGFISGHNKYSCGSDGASFKSYLPTDTTCSQEPYHSYPLPNYNKCPAEAELQMYTCLNATSLLRLSKSVRGVVNT